MSSHQRIEGIAPARIDFGGGWTDVPPYPVNEGGFVCNAAINLEAKALVSSGTIAPAVSYESPARGDDSLAMAVLQRSARWNPKLPLPALRLASNFPVGAGLGGSSAASVAALGALLAWHDKVAAPHEIAELSRAVEVEDMGIAGGRQDHYAAAHGGALGLEFGVDPLVRVLPVSLSATFSAELERRAILIYTGRSRISGDTINSVLQGYLQGNEQVCRSLQRMKELARGMFRALVDGDVDTLGALVGEHWEFQRALHSGISTPATDAIVSRGRVAGAIGAKALGASGGGCVLLIARDGMERDVRRAVEPLGRILEFRINPAGVRVSIID